MKIRQIRTYSLNCPLAFPLANAQGRRDTHRAVLVRILTESGIEGWGECVGTYEAVSPLILNLLAPLLLGQSAEDIEGRWQQMFNAVPVWARRGFHIAAMSGIDIALWDIRGKAMQKPLCQLISGIYRDRVPCYSTGLFFPECPEAEIIPSLLEEGHGYLEDGFRAIKIQIGRNMTYDAAIIRAMRREFPETILLADACRAYDLPEAIYIGRILADNRFSWFEEPLGINLPAQIRQLADAIPLSVAIGESEQTRWEFLPLLNSGATVIQVDMACCGGISEALQIRALAASHGLNLRPISSGSMVNFAAALHLVASENRFPGRADSPPIPLDCLADSIAPLRSALCEDGIVIEQGVARVPKSAGLGIVPDEAALRILCLQRDEISH